MDYDLLGFKSSIQSSCRYFLFFFSLLFMRKHSAAVSRSLKSRKVNEAGYVRSRNLAALLLFSFKISYHCLGRMTQY